MKRSIPQLLLLATVTCASAMGQINCASGPASQKLVCQFPFSTGALANSTALNNTAATQTAVAVATSLNIAMASQVSQLPVASASAGTVIVYRGGAPETFNNLGPILTDRGQTIGKGKVFLGFSASQYVFNNIDGSSLGHLPFSYSRAAYSGSGALQSTTYTTENLNLSFKLNQFVGIATVGLSNRVDVSAIIPWERVSLGATVYPSTNYVLNANNSLLFQYSGQQSVSSGTANGVGDAIFNIKSQLASGERASVSAELNVRTPTGDDLNFLGSGAWGFNPFVVYSYLAKVSPHAKVGYQWNTKTELNNPTETAGGNKSLPGGFQYDVGADWALMRRMTVAGDLLGSQFLNTPGISSSPVAIPGVANVQTSTPVSSSYSVNNASAGVKLSPAGSLVLSGNVLFQLNDNGLHIRPTPLVGISYKF